MKKLVILTLLITFSLSSIASKLFILHTGSIGQTKNAFNMKGVTIHFYNDDFVIGTSDALIPVNALVLAENAWIDPNLDYFLLFFDQSSREGYIKSISESAMIIHEGEDYLIVSVNHQHAGQLFPAVHGGILRISRDAAKFPSDPINYNPGSLAFRDEISDMLEQVNMDTLEAFVQHLQDFGTRNAYKPGSIQAQNWILGKFESYGLDVELHDFYMPGGPASDNVIATLTGTLYPDEYIVLGAHYDSYAGSNNEPGADDNATGTAGILEAARIMSQYQFDRTIIFATWSGEEYGLYGSDAWATEAAQNEMNILGYFNIDMAGYLQPGDAIHTDIIAPASAGELRQFYKDVCAIYLPDFQTFNGALSGGDSDHTSFNNNGYQGIFPFEDSQNYSPYIHTANDLIGPSVNNFEQHMTFVQAIIANVATMSGQLPAPENLVAQAGDQQVELSWNAVDGTINYNIYRNNEPEPYAISSEPVFTDTEVVNGASYTYYVTAIFANSGEESGPSNLVTVIPMPPISLPFFDDFETGAPYWTMEGAWGLQNGVYHSSANALTESPSGDYLANLDISSSLSALDLSGAFSAQISFWTRYNIESGYDYMYLEVSANGTTWDEIASFSGVENNWSQKTYSLDNYLGETNVIVRFRFTSDVYVEEDGMYIDDLEIMVTGVGLDEKKESSYKASLQFNPNPAQQNASLNYWLESSGMTKIILTDERGSVVKNLVNSWKEAGSYNLEVDIRDLSSGIYTGILENNGRKITRKLIIAQ